MVCAWSVIKVLVSWKALPTIKDIYDLPDVGKRYRRFVLIAILNFGD